MQIGKIQRLPYHLYYVNGAGEVWKAPMKGHKGTKAKVAAFKRPDKVMCWVNGDGSVVCKTR